MRKFVLVGVLALFTCGSYFCVAQDAAQSSTAKSSAGEKKATAVKRVNRLPSNFAKLGLSDSQRDKIYSIQHASGDQIDTLEAQIDTLKLQRDKEIDTVLSADQRKTLNDLTEAAKDAKAKSKKADTDKKSEASKSAASESKGNSK